MFTTAFMTHSDLGENRSNELLIKLHNRYEINMYGTVEQVLHGTPGLYRKLDVLPAHLHALQLELGLQSFP